MMINFQTTSWARAGISTCPQLCTCQVAVRAATISIFHLAAITEAWKVCDETSENVEYEKEELQSATERVKGQMNQFFRVLKNKLTIHIGCITAEQTLSEDDMP